VGADLDAMREPFSGCYLFVVLWKIILSWTWMVVHGRLCALDALPCMMTTATINYDMYWLGP